MPDWVQIVGQGLGHMKLPREERDEVIAELAAHLEQCYGDLCAAGSPDPEGYTLAQVSDWGALGRRIRKSKEEPMSFSRKVLFPGLAALFLAQALQLTLHKLLVPIGGTPTEWQFRWTGGIAWPGAFYLPWLVTLPLAGALGAWLARGAGAGFRQRLTAALFPAFLVPALGIPVTIFWLFADPQRVLAIRLADQAALWLTWAIVPVVACALGALPLLSGAPHPAEHTPPTHAASA